MERSEAKAIYEQGSAAVIAALLMLSAQIAKLNERLAKQDERIAELGRRSMQATHCYRSTHWYARGQSEAV